MPGNGEVGAAKIITRRERQFIGPVIEAISF